MPFKKFKTQPWARPEEIKVQTAEVNGLYSSASIVRVNQGDSEEGLDK
jgi:hypothetical protein